MTTELDRSYARCRELTRQHGTTYFWAANLLDRAQRRHVWALYAFARHADDIVDDAGPSTADERGHALAELGQRLFDDLKPVSYTHLTLPTKRIV